ncbi:MAG: UvrD-helicase domain-containing protein [Deltaproteobacteria bacterium]|nr:UvrD-helicase domain-containing protein [Deltaproteobacteria bacterium]
MVQAQGCTSFEDYRGASRRGRGQAIRRSDRRQLWPVYQRYRDLLDRDGLRERQDALWDAARLLETPLVPPPYRAAVVDEAQDMSTVAFRLIRALIPAGEDDLFIVGDGHQRIYRRKVVLSQAGIQIVGRSRKLRVNYRTPEEIRRAAVGVLEGCAIDDLDGGVDDAKGYVSLLRGGAPILLKVASFAEEADALAAFAQEGDLSRTCLVCRSGRLLDAYEAALSQRGIETLRLSRDQGDDRSRPGLRLATMHRVKGLEFDRVMIAGLYDWQSTVEHIASETDDAAIRAAGEVGERALLYVALTRARREVMVSWSGEGRRLVE